MPEVGVSGMWWFHETKMEAQVRGLKVKVRARYLT